MALSGEDKAEPVDPFTAWQALQTFRSPSSPHGHPSACLFFMSLLLPESKCAWRALISWLGGEGEKYLGGRSGDFQQVDSEEDSKLELWRCEAKPSLLLISCVTLGK
jgi:hypothetical protein